MPKSNKHSIASTCKIRAESFDICFNSCIFPAMNAMSRMNPVNPIECLLCSRGLHFLGFWPLPGNLLQRARLMVLWVTFGPESPWGPFCAPGGRILELLGPCPESCSKGLVWLCCGSLLAQNRPGALFLIPRGWILDVLAPCPESELLG